MTSANIISRAIDIDGVHLYADTRSGAAPSLVFHYWGGSRRTWQPVLTRLHPDQAFVNYDQRGWGDSPSSNQNRLHAAVGTVRDKSARVLAKLIGLLACRENRGREGLQRFENEIGGFEAAGRHGGVRRET